MDASGFDRLARTLASPGTRRALLRLLSALPVAGTLLSVLDQGSEADRRRDQQTRKKSNKGDGRNESRRGKPDVTSQVKGKGGKCTKDGQCTSQKCSFKPGDNHPGRCLPSRANGRCRLDADCRTGLRCQKLPGTTPDGFGLCQVGQAGQASQAPAASPPPPGCTPTCPPGVCGVVADGCGGTTDCACSGATPVCDGGTCRACAADEECCGAPNSGKWCQSGACVTPGGFADCQGFCAAPSAHPGTIIICGQTVQCPPCYTCGCSGLSCEATSGPFSVGRYCVQGTPVGPCFDIFTQCPSGQVCCDGFCLAVCTS